MVIVRLEGGLGNQMFQYATGLGLAARRHTRLKIDTSFLLDRTPRENIVFRDYDLELFHVPEEIANAAEIRRFRRMADPGSRSLLEKVKDKFSRRCFYREQSLNFDPQVMTLPEDTYLEGYFQNERYFRDVEGILRVRFAFSISQAEVSRPTKELAAQIRNTDSVCVNVRRGDYVSNPVTHRHHGVCGIDYFTEAANYLMARLPNLHFFVFSDDPDWCFRNLKFPCPTTLADPATNGPRYFHKLWLMTQCQHFVISNSSFGWWAAWLASNPGKMVVRPAFWLRADEGRDLDIGPSTWIKIANAWEEEAGPELATND